MDIAPILIAVGGCSGSGKTTLAVSLARELDAELIPLDAYYRDRPGLTKPERDELNYDAPDAIEHELLTAHLRKLLRGEAVQRPVYDFATHTRESETVLVEPREHLIVEGILALHWPEILQLCAVSVYVDLDDAECFRRRFDRDTRSRGRSAESVQEQYAHTVRPMAKRFVIPTRQRADLVVSGAAPLASSVAAVVERSSECGGGRPAAADAPKPPADLRGNSPHIR